MRSGYKGVSLRLDEDGEPFAYRVFVQWKGHRRDTTIWLHGSSPEGVLGDAVAKRDEFERELRKPRSERQITTAGDGLSIRGTNVIANLGHHARVSFGLKLRGKSAAMEKAKKARRKAGFP